VSQMMGYRWHLRLKMAEQGMFATTELRPLLAARGVVLSREQVYRLVTGVPERLALRTLAALCDILDCTPSDLVEPVAETGRASRRAAAPGGAAAGPGELRPVRARIISEPGTGR
jgi:DNA-binding Xre family transcriptional regulator